MLNELIKQVNGIIYIGNIQSRELHLKHRELNYSKELVLHELNKLVICNSLAWHFHESIVIKH